MDKYNVWFEVQEYQDGWVTMNEFDTYQEADMVAQELNEGGTYARVRECRGIAV